jgi:glycosyltransferase involved in cell wall biosynthesis
MGLFTKLRFSILTIIETISMVFSNELIVICQNLKKHLLSRYFLSRKRIHVVPNAIDITRISTSSTIKGKSPHEISFGYIGSLSQIEGIDLLINAFHKLKANGFRNKLIIIGNGIEKDNLKKLSEGNELIENRDAVLLDEINSVYDSIDIVINPRRKSLLSDTVTPLKPLEAIMYRKLVMASNIGGMRELLEHNKTAILFKPDSINAIFEAIIHTINRDDIRLIIDNGVRRLSSNRSWHINAENYLRIYTALIKSYRR